MTQINQLIQSILNEGRDAPLYHSITIKHLEKVFREDKLIGFTEVEYSPYDKSFDGLSLTRNYKFAFNYKKFEDNSVALIFVLDQRKLSQRYKILPYDYFVGSKDSRREGKQDDKYSPVLTKYEFEEVLVGGIKNLSKYIISINIKKKDIPNMNKYWKILSKYRNKLNLKVPRNFQKYYLSNSEMKDLLDANIS